jgi:hypothetical protein
MKMFNSSDPPAPPLAQVLGNSLVVLGQGRLIRAH